MPLATRHSSLVTPYSLALHTSTPELGLAIAHFTGQCRHQVWDLGRDTSTLLHAYLVDFLPPQTWHDLVFIAVAKGPGGFTGTRIGVVTARTLAQQLEIPLFGISTLAAVAWEAAKTLENSMNIAVQMPAQRGEVFGAIYQRDRSQNQLVEILPDAVMSLEAWETLLKKQDTAYHLIIAEGGLGRYVTSILEIAQVAWNQGDRPHWSEVLPFYGQHPVI
ncbi:tRNA (adenosine(37)-N6)-threonylcarbamoyltransferase complex dimerization subunit type 1 TsaB [Leptolyngbyaceae cyanobacterium UHCC 1019]